MLKTILGLMLLVIPFLLLSRFQDKKKGFFYILSFLIFFHLTLAVITQSLGIFRYNIILVINIVLSFIAIFKTNWKIIKENLKNIKIDWILIFVILIVSIELFSVHFNYTGKISDINNLNQNLKEVKNMKYIYPYFSDEWAAVSLITYSIENKNLPFANPLWKNSYFPNLEFAFHSFLSEFFLLLNLNPLTSYVIFSAIAGILICFLVYFILRFNNIERFASAFSALSIPLIVNGGSLPGIWYLIPLTLGIISLLLSFIFMSLKDSKMILFSSFLTLIFYPPLFVLSIFSILFYFIFSQISIKNKIKYILIYFVICFIIVLILSFKLFLNPNLNAFNFITSKILYVNFTKDMFPDYAIWKVIPLFSLLFAIPALKKFKDKLWIFLPIAIGLDYWLLYSKVLWRFIIDYDRIVFTTSILIVLVSGFGMDYLINYINKFLNKRIIKILKTAILLIFLIFAFNYTLSISEKAEELKFYAYGKILNPSAPATVYLQKDDLDLFKNIKEKTFIAPPWKGLVIGVSTKNYPLETKPSTITNEILSYNKFMDLNCEKKKETASLYKIDYVYSSNFSCKYFIPIGKTNELLLYEFQNF